MPRANFSGNRRGDQRRADGKTIPVRFSLSKTSENAKGPKSSRKNHFRRTVETHRSQSAKSPRRAREAEALSHINRSRRPARRERVLIFASGNPISQSKNRFLAVSAPGNPKDFSGNWRGWQEAQNPQDSAFLPCRQNCRGSNFQFEPRHPAGKLAPPSTSL